MRSQFERAESEARKAGRGLWKDVTEDEMPPWRRDWLARHAAARN
jgi:endonuclease YncB( thermonuclease family)